MPADSFATKNVLVTGCRKGIGRFLVDQFLSLGASVYGCSRTETDWEAPNYQHFLCDVNDESAVKKMFSELRDKGGVDILINNAGIASMNHFLLTPKQTFEKLVGTNLIGTFLCSREAAKQMQRKKSGRIVNFTTVAVPLSLAGESAYVATKSGVEALTKVAASELGEFGITVNAVGPTPIDTDLIRSVPQDKIQKIIDRQALKRLGTPEDVWNVVRFFSDPSSSFITGQTIYLGGV